MEGRWTIHKWAGMWDDVIDGPDTDPLGVGAMRGIPVVPCDDAAMQRVADALSHYMHSRSYEFVQAAAEAALRAAGEMP